MAKCKQCGRNMPGFTLKKTCAWCQQYEAAQRGEVSDVQPVMVAPWRRGMSSSSPVTYALLIINVMIFIVMVASGVSISEPSGQDIVTWGSNFGPYTLGGQYWRLFTHMFVHIGAIHLLFNMWFLYQLGAQCEELLGSVTYTVMYLISGVAGGVASLAWHPYTNSAGASGALFGILGAMIAAFKFGEFSLPSALVKASLRSMLLCAGINLLIGMTGGIDNAAHIGGGIAGFVIGFLVVKAAPDSEDFGKRALVMVLVASAVGGGFWWETKASTGARAPRERYAQLLRQNKPKEAIAELQLAIKKDPDDVHKRLFLASLYDRQQMHAEALQQYVWVLTHSSGDEITRNMAGTMLASHYIATRQYAEGENYFSQMVSKDASDPLAHSALAMLAEAQDHYDGAIAEFQKLTVAQPTPDQPHAFQLMGFAGLARNYAKLNRYDESIAAYQKAIALDEGDDSEDDYGLRQGLAEVQKAKQAAQRPK
jgi:membrane associated rhomboid family serine protease/cytochrome c-type biogenesis protein CcmH/NrfG